jgi:hypothetical protein
MHLGFDDGSQSVTSTDASWSALNVDSLYRPSEYSEGGGYTAPQENTNGSAFPGQASWTTDPVTVTAGGWQPAAVRTPFPAGTVHPKPTLPLEIEEGVVPAMETLAEGHYFFDFGEGVHYTSPMQLSYQ